MIASLRKLCFCVAAAEDWELSAGLVWQPNDQKKTLDRQRHLCELSCQPSRFPSSVGRYVILAQLGLGWGGVC